MPVGQHPLSLPDTTYAAEQSKTQGQNDSLQLRRGCTLWMKQRRRLLSNSPHQIGGAAAPRPRDANFEVLPCGSEIVVRPHLLLQLQCRPGHRWRYFFPQEAGDVEPLGVGLAQFPRGFRVSRL